MSTRGVVAMITMSVVLLAGVVVAYQRWSACDAGAVADEVHLTDEAGQYRGDAGRTGAVGSSGPQADSVIRWCHRMDEPGAHFVSRDTVLVGVGRDRTEALDLRTGRVRWAAEGRAMAVAGDRAFVAAGSDVRGLDIADGATRWSFARGNRVVTSEPAIVGPSLFVGLSEGSGDDSSVVALDVTTGAVRWEHALGDVAAGVVAADERRVVLFVRRMTAFDEHSTYVVALDASSGAELWSSESMADIRSVVLDDHAVLVLAGIAQDEGGDGVGGPHRARSVVRSLDAWTGARQWEHVVERACQASEITSTDGVVVVSSDLDCPTFGLNRGNGATRWTIDDVGRPWVVGGEVVGLDRAGADIVLVTVDPQTGTERSRVRTAVLPFHWAMGPGVGASVVVDGLVVVGVDDRIVVIG